jgi:hypothetical protein
MSDAKPTSSIARCSLYLGLASIGLGVLYAMSEAGILGVVSLIGALATVVIALIGVVTVLADFGQCRGIGHSLGGGMLGLVCVGLFIPAG